jgi:hypothetical protein
MPIAFAVGRPCPVHLALSALPRILDTVTIVRPETVVRWHRMGYAAFWQWKSRVCGGRPRIGKEVRDLIRRMSLENPLWGAPRIHGELRKLGINLAQSTVSIYMVPSRAGRCRAKKRSFAIMGKL